MKVSEMPAGQALDILVAERVMGYKDDGSWPHQVTDEDGGTGDRLPEYSTSIAAAWEVVEKMATRGIWMAVSDMRHGRYTIEHAAPWSGWWATWMRTDRSTDLTEVEGDHDWAATGDTAPLALCRAALLAVGITDA
jgi:hypothetical protein